jgi:hypothetical protein
MQEEIWTSLREYIRSSVKALVGFLTTLVAFALWMTDLVLSPRIPQVHAFFADLPGQVAPVVFIVGLVVSPFFAFNRQWIEGRKREADHMTEVTALQERIRQSWKFVTDKHREALHQEAARIWTDVASNYDCATEGSVLRRSFCATFRYSLRCCSSDAKRYPSVTLPRRPLGR